VVSGAAAGGVSYALHNPGKSLDEYVRDAEFRKAVGTDAASGAVAVAAAVPLGFAALGLKAATAGGAAFIGGVGGSLAGAAGQITANLLTPCTKWHQGVRRAMFWGGLGGAAFGWAGWHVGQWWTSRVVKATNVYQDNNGYWRTADGRFARNPNLSANDATTRSSAMKERFLREFANSGNAPSEQIPWLQQGRVPPGYNVDHRIPLSMGGPDTTENMRLILIADHVIRHRYYHPWR
jgi:hypothetical protein